jgi:phosphate acetyltransferase
MSSEHYLERLSEKALIVVPSDRSDIITATILGLYSKNIPNVSGIILTGNMKLSASIEKLLKGLDSFTLPILSTSWDTYQSVIKINEIKVKITPDSSRKIALAMGLFFDNIDAKSLLIHLNTPTHHSMTPAMFQYTLFEKARNNKKTIVLPESEDERILRASEILLRRGVANIILLGDREEILHRAGVLGLDLSDAQIIDPNTSDLRERFADEFYLIRQHKGLQIQAAHDAMAHGNYFGTMLVYKGLADGMVSGAIHTTADTVRPALQIIKTAPGISIVSSVFFMCLETQVLVYGDCAVNQNPNANELAQIAISSAKTAKAFGIEPRVAMLSYSTGESGSGEDVEKVKAATHIAKTIDPSLLIEGPIQYDAAIDSNVASIKLPHSDVAGKANVFIFPDLNTGNNTYKAVQRSSGAIAIGPVLQGLNKPINDLSRGCLVEDIVNTVAITAIQAGTV